MKKNLLYIALAFSMLINVAVLCVLLKGNISSTTKEEESPKEVSPFADYNKRQTAAENAVRRYVCENLYYPNSYDPVSTKVDSVFYNYLTDEDCVKATFELIDLRKSYESAKDTYDENVNNNIVQNASTKVVLIVLLFLPDLLSNCSKTLTNKVIWTNQTNNMTL